MITAKWKDGFEHFFHADAQLVAEEILSIGESATPRQILEKGRDETTELHKCFEWDDTIAADRYRLSQARAIVRTLVIAPRQDAPGKPEIRHFYKTDSKSGYKSTELIFRQEDEKIELMRRCLAELRNILRKYRFLSNNEHMDRLLQEIEAMIA